MFVNYGKIICQLVMIPAISNIMNERIDLRGKKKGKIEILC